MIGNHRRREKNRKYLKNNNDRIKERQRFILNALMECQRKYRREKSYLNNVIIFKNTKESLKKPQAHRKKEATYAEIAFKLKSYFSTATLNQEGNGESFLKCVKITFKKTQKKIFVFYTQLNCFLLAGQYNIPKQTRIENVC